MTIKKLWNIVRLPLLVLAVFGSLWAIWRLLDLPEESRMIEVIKEYFERYGYGIVFVSAILEGILLAGWYYPGSLVIFLGVIFAGKNIPEVALVILLVSAGMFVAYIFDYALGKYGWYKLLVRFGLNRPIEMQQERISKYGVKAIFLSYWHPNLAALTATAAGILRFSFSKFLICSVIALVLWNIFWGTLAYFLGEAALSVMGIRFVLIAVFVWIVYRIIFPEKKVVPESHE